MKIIILLASLFMLSCGNSSNTVNIDVPNKTVLTSELIQHNKTTDCWMIIDGVVYDVTQCITTYRNHSNWLSPYCGKDGSSAWQGEAQKHKKELLQNKAVGKFSAN